MAAPLQLAVLSDRYLQQWQIDTLRNATDLDKVSIRLVVVNEPKAATTKAQITGAGRAVNAPTRLSLGDILLALRIFRMEGSWALVLAERKLNWLLTGVDEMWAGMRTTAVEEVPLFGEAEMMTCSPEGEGKWNELPREVVRRVRQDSDVVVRFGFGLLRGEILTATKFGVLSFHAADIRRYRGQGPEQVFLNNDKVAGVTLQRLSEDIDGGEIVAFEDVSVDDCRTYDCIVTRIRRVQRHLLKRGIQNLRDPDFVPTAPDRLGKYYSHAERRRLFYGLRFVAKNLWGRLASIL